MPIKVLSKILVDKIAAGEVIERPASVVKELVENSIDAGAQRIEVELAKGGAKLIKVVDNGCGMARSDVELAFLSHATSKLQSEDDLFNVSTMGFRGEALSSIASVSQARLISRTRDTDEAYEITAEGGDVGAVKVCGAPPGTQVEVRNLFYNVPVRRKFLKTQATEMAHITEAITRAALAHHKINFVLTHNGRQVFNLPQAEDRQQRLSALFGEEIAKNIIPLNLRHPEVDIEGYLLPPSVSRSNTNMQYTYVNRRYIREKTLMHAIGEAYRGLMQKRRRPVCFLFLTIDPADVDVNVHPTKTEVKFRHGGTIHSQVVSAMRDALRQAKLTPEVEFQEQNEGESSENQQNIKSAIADFFDAQENPSSARPSYSASHNAPQRRNRSIPRQRPTRDEQRFFQVLNRYIVEECDDSIQIIDQHALHERILYEHIRQELAGGPLNSQQLLVPDLVELTQPEFYAVMDMKEDLAAVGMKIEDFGEKTVIVRSVPQILRKFDGASFFRELIEEFGGPGKARRLDNRIDQLAKVMACRGAVKAGQALDRAQLKSILDQRASAENVDTCPHGRPTTILLTRKNLDEQFERT